VQFYTDVAGFAGESVSVMLFVYGGAGAVGLVLVGLVAARFPSASLVIAFTIVAAAVLVIGLFPSATVLVIVAVAVWGIAFGAGPALLQTRMLHTASARIRDQASAWFTVSFNVGIGGGAFIGGLVYDGYGLGVLPFVETGVVVFGVLFVLATDRVLSRRRSAAFHPAPVR
jgi:predicted MFS family arabinose efflux permease